jgi:hypothetical protein
MWAASLQRYVAQQPLPKLLAWFGLFFVTIALGAVGLLRILPTLLGAPEQIDFAAYYVAARLLNADGQLYDPAAMRDAAAQAGSIHYTPYIYPPFFAAALRPLGLLPYRPAELCWLALNTIFWIGSVVTLCRMAAVPRALYVPVVCLTGLLPAVYDTMLLGQTSLLITALLVGSLWFAQSRPAMGSEVLAGVLLGIAISIKLYPAVLGLVYLVHGRRTTLIAAGITCLAAGIVGVGFGGGWEASRAYFVDLLPNVAQLSPFPSNQSLRGVLARFFSHNQFSVPVLSRDNALVVSLRPLVDAPALGTALAYTFGLGIVVVSVWAMARARRPSAVDGLMLRDMGLTTTVMLLITPVVWDNYFTHLLISLFALRYASRRAVSPLFVGLCACLLLVLGRYWRFMLLYAQSPFLMMFGCAATLMLWASLLPGNSSAHRADTAPAMAE